jgi:hypothetical protein
MSIAQGMHIHKRMDDARGSSTRREGESPITARIDRIGSRLQQCSAPN